MALYVTASSATKKFLAKFIAANSGNTADTFARGDDPRLAGALTPTALAAELTNPASPAGAALLSTYAARSLRQYGKLAGRVDVAHISGRTSGYGTVTTALTQGVQAVIPLAELIDVTTLAVVTNGIKAPAALPPSPVEIAYRATFTGGTAGKRIVRLLINGIEVDSAQAWGADVTVLGRLEYRLLSPADTVTLTAWSDATGSSVSAARRGDVWLKVALVTPRRVEPALLGWAWPEEVPGLEGKRGIYGMFMARTSWADIASNLMTSTAYATWVAANRTKAADVAGPLTPYFMVGINHNTELDALTAGTHDTEMATLGAALATTGPDTVYYRPFPEFNYTAIFSMTSAKFVAAWQHAIPLIRTAFATAARPGQVLKIVWCFGGDGPDPQFFWPGSTHVDVVSVDTYLKKYNATATASNVTLQIALDICRACSIAATNGKPVAISEWANVATGAGALLWYGMGDWGDGIDYVHDWIERAGLLYAVYFNSALGDVRETLADIPNSRAKFIERFNLLTP